MHNSMQTATYCSQRPPLSPASTNWFDALRAYLVTVGAIDLFWEAAHLPLYALWHIGTLRENLFAVVHCTAGDLLIALAALTTGLMLAGHRDWPARRFAAVAGFTLAVGFGYTVFSEWLNVVVRKSWAYSSLMPVISIFSLNLGLSPLLQWVVVPVLALYASRRIGSRASSTEKMNEGKANMMCQGMMHGGAMMWGMGGLGLLAVAALILLVAASAKYLFFE
jgi:hypothetical protein